MRTSYNVCPLRFCKVLAKLEAFQKKFNVDFDKKQIDAAYEVALAPSMIYVQGLLYKAWTKCKTKGDLLKAVDAALLQLPKPKGIEIEHASHFPPALAYDWKTSRV